MLLLKTHGQQLAVLVTLGCQVRDLRFEVDHLKRIGSQGVVVIAW
jgi:hypothetical protein